MHIHIKDDANSVPVSWILIDKTGVRKDLCYEVMTAAASSEGRKKQKENTSSAELSSSQH